MPMALTGAGRLWLPLVGGALALALLSFGLHLVYDHGRTVERAEWQARWNARDTAEQSARVDALAAARTEERRRQIAVNEVANDARKEQAAAIDGGDRADAAGDRLHVAAQDLASRASCAAGDTGIAQRGEAARRAALVLSDLLEKADRRAGELARFADQSRIAGLACERAYKALSPDVLSARLR